MLENLKPMVNPRNCKIRTILGTLNESDKEILLNALADEATWPAITLQRSLQHLDIQVGQEVIRRHRTGLCSCSKA